MFFNEYNENKTTNHTNLNKANIISDFESLKIACKQDETKVQEDEISYKDVTRLLYASPYPKDFKSQLTSIPKEIVYNLWEILFFESETKAYDNISDSMSKLETQQKENRGKYLGELTDYVLSAFRDKITITDKFLCKMFEHGLDKQIIFLVENEKFFNVSLKEGTLIDVCLALSCDFTNVKVFTRLLPNLRMEHISYAIRYAAYDFLMLMWKMRRWIPNYKEHITQLRKTMKNKTWKQMKYFDWVEANT